MYSDKQKEILLKIARNSIKKKYYPDSYIEDINDIELNEKRAVFVTLKKNNNLRGCIGHLQPMYPLKEAVEKMAFSAAFSDPRFPKLSEKELKEINIEISVLSLTKKINSISEIQMKVHGVVLKKGFYRSVFLPQVAVETNWSKEVFLQNLAIKAGLNADDHKDAEYEVFTVCEFNE